MCSRSASSSVTAAAPAGDAPSNSARGTVSTGPFDRMTARSITFWSSRILPGHDHPHSTSRLSRETDSIDRRRRFANRCAK
jgi:hypothetical protein